MARMTNFRSAAIATGNAIDESAYDNVKVVADSINKITEIANFITEHDVDLSALSTILNKLGTSTSEQLAALAELDLKQFVKDLTKGNYLGNRKIDINLALNIKGITETLIKESPQEAEDLWTNNSQNVMYDKATITFVDGTVVTLPFLLDSNPTVVTNSYGLLVQFDRNDAVKAVAQEDLIYSFDVQDNTTYTVEINNIHYTYTTGGNATRGEIVTGLTNQINSGSEPWTAYNEIDNIRIKADTAGEAFVASVGINMLIRTDVENVTAGNYPTKFLNKLKNPTKHNDNINLVYKNIDDNDEWILQAHMKTDYSSLSNSNFSLTLKEYLIFEIKQKFNLLFKNIDELSFMDIMIENNITSKPFLSNGINLNDSKWQEFKIIDLFKLKKGERLTEANRISGETPLITASSYNNGITSFIDYENFKDKKKPFSNKITVDMFGNVFYHNYEYYSDDNIHTLLLKDKYKIELSDYTQIFLVAILKEMSFKYGFGRQVRLHRLENEVIKLPISKKNIPNWDFMEDFIKSMPYSSNI